MSKYPNIVHALDVIFNVETGLAEDKAIAMYLRSAGADGRMVELQKELCEAFSDSCLSWVELLSNDDYDAFYAASEDEARAYAKRVLWNPVFGQV